MRSTMIVSSAFLVTLFPSGAAAQDITLLKDDRSPGRREEGPCLPGSYTSSKITWERGKSKLDQGLSAVPSIKSGFVTQSEKLRRVRAALRRATTERLLPKIETRELNVDVEKRAVDVRGDRIHLTPREFDVLRLLVTEEGKTLTYKRILQAVWGPDYWEETENLRVVIKQLRKKIEKDPARPRYILTEPRLGYRFQLPSEAHAKRPRRKLCPISQITVLRMFSSRANPKSRTGLPQDSSFNLSVRTLSSLEGSFLCLSFSCPDSTISRSSHTQSNRAHCTRVHHCHGGSGNAHRWSGQRPRRLPTTNCGRQARRGWAEA
jgi:DNA-binding winged helix-turn-helix (wHTH) protein